MLSLYLNFLLRPKKILLLVFCFVFLSKGHAEDTVQPLPQKIFFLADQKITLEVAETVDQQSRGLMYRKHLGKNSGMLFVYPSERLLTFWMKNTLIPLSIGFFNKEKLLIEVQEMSVPTMMDTSPKHYVSKYPAMYALEMNAGWFKKNKIEVSKAKLSWTKE